MKNYLEYRGYRGLVEFSDVDSVFFGTISGINDLVTFEGTSVEEIKSAFYGSVDDYLETCREIGKKPEKEFKGSFNVRVDREIHRLAAKKAQTEKISLNKLVDKALRKELESSEQ